MLTGEEIEEEEMDGVQEEEVTSEEQFEMKVFLMSFSSPRVIQVYGLLLTLWKTNDIHTNHCIVKMLHRITVQVRVMRSLSASLIAVRIGAAH